MSVIAPAANVTVHAIVNKVRDTGTINRHPRDRDISQEALYMRPCSLFFFLSVAQWVEG